MGQIEHIPLAVSPGPWRPMALLLLLALGALFTADLVAEREIESTQAAAREQARREHHHRARAAAVFGDLAHGRSGLAETDRAWLAGFSAGISAQVDGSR